MIFILYLFFIFQYYTGSALAFAFKFNESVTLRIVAFVGVLFSIIEFLRCFKNFSYRQKRCIYFVLIFYFLVGLSLIITYVVNDLSNSLMNTYLLSFFSITLSGIMLGFCGFKRIRLDKIGPSIFFFSLFFTIPLLISTIQDSGRGLVYQTGIDGQTISYASSYIVVLLLFFLNNNLKIAKNQLINQTCKIICLLLIGLNSFVLLSGGGRGAFLTVIIAFLIYFIKALRHRNYKAVISWAAVIFIGLLFVGFLGEKINISSGISKIVLLFGDIESDLSANERIILYQKGFAISSDRLFIGTGAGSTTYDLGFYSHNVLLDVLLDFGLLGLVAFVAFIAYLFVCFFKEKNHTTEVNFFVLMLVSSLISLMFSKAWLIDCHFWYAISSLTIYIVSDKKAYMAEFENEHVVLGAKTL